MKPVAWAALQLGHITQTMISDEGGEITRLPHQTESWLADIKAEITYGLAGRVAERVIFGDVSASAGESAQSDLAKATQWALDIEAIYGLGCKGPVWHGGNKDALLRDPVVEARVRQRSECAERRAGEILACNRQVLEALAQDLVQKRSLNGADISLQLRNIPPSEAVAALPAKHSNGMPEVGAELG